MSNAGRHGGGQRRSWRRQLGAGAGSALGMAMVLAMALGAGSGCAVIEAEPHRAPPLELSALNVNVNLNVQNGDSSDEVSWFSDPKLASGLMALAMVECEDSAGRGLGVADWGLVLVNSTVTMNRALAAETATPAPVPDATAEESVVKVVARGSRSPGAPDMDEAANSIGKASPFLTGLLVLHERDPAAARDLARDCLSAARGLLLYQQANGEWPLDRPALDVWLAAQAPDSAAGALEAGEIPPLVSWKRGRGDRLRVSVSSVDAADGGAPRVRPEYTFLLRPLCLQAFVQRSLDRRVSLRNLPAADAPASLRDRSVWTALLLQSLVSADAPAQPASLESPPIP